MTTLNPKERVVLTYLSPLMEATAKMIGEHLYANGLCNGGFIAVGAAVCGRLRERDLITRLSDLAAWRITAKGRKAIGIFDKHKETK